MTASPSLAIGALAIQASVNVETIRFYHRKGLLPLPPRPARGARRYTADAVDRVRFIKAAQTWGFSLREVAVLLRLQDGTGCEEARRLAEDRLAVVNARLRDLRRVATNLRASIAACNDRKGRVTCPLVATLRAGS